MQPIRTEFGNRMNFCRIPIGGAQLSMERKHFQCCQMSEFRVVQSKRKKGGKSRKLAKVEDNRDSSPADIDVDKLLQ